MLLRQFEFLQASKCFGLLEEALTALEKLELARPGLGWYEATRHTFASQWVLSGGSIEKLKEMLGHYSVVVTERYAHLRPDLFPASDLGTIELDLLARGPEHVEHRRKMGSRRPDRLANRLII